MPIPFIPVILGAISIAAAGKGIKSGIDAYDDMSTSKGINTEAEKIVATTNQEIMISKERTTDRIEILGMSKVEILTTTMTDFVENFKKIKNVIFKESDGLNELSKFNVSSKEFLELQSTVIDAKKVTVNGLTAVGGSALLAYGAYSAVMGGGFALASTGVGITSLSGVAATNATLAWLGGGSLATGGLGMTGGMVVLGGLVVGPALAIGGSLFASQARKALNDAKSNKEKAELFAEDGEMVKLVLESILVRASQLNGILNILNQYFLKSLNRMKLIMHEKGTDWKQYNTEEQHQIYLAVQLAQTIKVILDTKLLDEEGQLQEQSFQALDTGKKYLLQMENI